MPVITLTLAKIGLMVLLYLFLFWVFRVVGKEVRDTTEPERASPDLALAHLPTPMIARAAMTVVASCRLQLARKPAGGTTVASASMAIGIRMSSTIGWPIAKTSRWRPFPVDMFHRT